MVGKSDNRRMFQIWLISNLTSQFSIRAQKYRGDNKDIDNVGEVVLSVLNKKPQCVWMNVSVSRNKGELKRKG